MARQVLLNAPRGRLMRQQKQRLDQILRTPTPFIEYDCFHQGTEIMNLLRKKVSIAADETLSADQERTLFLQLNYYRCWREVLRLKVQRQLPHNMEDVTQLLHWDGLQHDLQGRLVSHNLGLVSYMARHCNFSGVDFEELVCEGNIGLLRAIDRFDCMRGFRFSTYACRAIMLSMSRYARQQFKQWRRFPISWEPSHETSNHLEQMRKELCQDHIRTVVGIIRDNDAELTDMEKSVLERRFSLDNPEGRMMTLKDIGTQLDLSKERVRQIQNQALSKVRQATMETLAAEE